MGSAMDEVEDILDPPVDVADFEPELTDILPRGYLSVSQVTTFLKCPKQWALRYLDGVTGKSSARMFQGIFVHAAVEKILGDKIKTGSLPPLDEATDVFSDSFEKQKPVIEDWEGQDPGFYKDTGVQCTRIFYQEAAPTAMPIQIEKPFLTTIKTSDGKIKLPVLGRIDSIQVQAFNEKEYNDIREKVAAQATAHEHQTVTEKAAGRKPKPFVPEGIVKPKRIHDLKVVTDKWSEKDLENDIQFGLYAGVEHIPDVQVDQLVKGRAKVPRPRYEVLSGVMDPGFVQHTLNVVEGVAKSIALGHFPLTDPSNWWCSSQWCPVWHACRGKKEGVKK